MMGPRFTHASPRTLLWSAALLGALIVGGCRCEGGVSRRFAEIEVSPELIDFGTVQVNVEHTADLRIFNPGAAPLNVAEFRVEAPFSVKQEPPTIGVGEELIVQVVFTPTEIDKRVSGTLVIVSDAPDDPEVTVELVGAGIASQAKAQPEVLDFGDVWVGESKTLDLKISNTGTNTLTVNAASFADGTPSTLSGTITSLVGDIEPGTSKTAQVTFAPTAITTDIPGAVRLELAEEDGSELVVPFAGRGVRAVPRLCFKFNDSPMEQCTDPNASATNPGNLTVTFPPLCDSVIYPPDGGSPPTACAESPYEATGKFYVRNEGNVPVKYSMQYTAAVNKSCDGGTPERSDFAFANAPDGGVIEWSVPTVQLPASASDPWESAPVDVTYAATANCLDEATDQAYLVWTRQGDARQPFVLTATVTGKSRLPDAEPADYTFQGGIPSEVTFSGAVNQGTAEFQITGAELWEVVTPVPGGACDGPDAGFFQPCDFTNPVSDCFHFGYADGGDPNVTAPHTVPIASDAGAGVATIGTLIFGANGTTQQNQYYCVYSVVQTTDPFQPQVVSRIRAIRTQ